MSQSALSAYRGFYEMFINIWILPQSAKSECLWSDAIFTKTLVKCTDCLTLWNLCVWNSNTTMFHFFFFWIWKCCQIVLVINLLLWSLWWCSGHFFMCSFWHSSDWIFCATVHVREKQRSASVILHAQCYSLYFYT